MTLLFYDALVRDSTQQPSETSLIVMIMIIIITALSATEVIL